jgi:hypothetical protein
MAGKVPYRELRYRNCEIMTSGLAYWERKKNHLTEILMLHRKMIEIFCENDFQAGVSHIL